MSSQFIPIFASELNYLCSKVVALQGRDEYFTAELFMISCSLWHCCKYKKTFAMDVTPRKRAQVVALRKDNKL